MPIASTQERNVVMRFLATVLPFAFKQHIHHFVLYSSNKEYALLTNSTWRFDAWNIKKAKQGDQAETEKKFVQENQGVQTFDQRGGVYTMINKLMQRNL